MGRVNEWEFYAWMTGFLALVLGLTGALHLAIMNAHASNKPDAGAVEAGALVAPPPVAPPSPRCRCGADES